MAKTQVRVPGGGNTFIKMGFENTPVRVAFLANFFDQPGRSVGNPTPIHPIGNAYPVEIAVPYAQSAGTLTLTVWALWGKDGWVSAFANNYDRSPWKKYKSKHGYTSSGYKWPVDLREVLEAQREVGGYLTCKKYELAADGKSVARVKDYQRCVITDIDASDNVSIEQMEQRVKITCMYAFVKVTSGKGESVNWLNYD